MFNWKVAALLAFVSIVPCATVRADVIANLNLTGTTGAFTYSYQIDNQTAVDILSFSLDVTGDVANIQAPNGWVFGTGIPNPGETLVQWISLDVPFDIPAFGTLSGFVFTSSDSPGTVAFSTLDENFSEFDGQTQGPVASSVPEPNTVFLICPVAVAFLIMVSKRARLRLNR